MLTKEQAYNLLKLLSGLCEYSYQWGLSHPREHSSFQFGRLCGMKQAVLIFWLWGCEDAK